MNLALIIRYVEEFTCLEFLLPVSKESLPLTCKVLDTMTLDSSASFLSNLYTWTCCEFSVCGIVHSVPFFLTGLVLRKRKDHSTCVGKVSIYQFLGKSACCRMYEVLTCETFEMRQRPTDDKVNSVTMTGLCENWCWYNPK